MKVVIIDKAHPNYGKLCVVSDSEYKNQEHPDLEGLAIKAVPVEKDIYCAAPLATRDQFITKELFDACATIITSKLLFGRDI